MPGVVASCAAVGLSHPIECLFSNFAHIWRVRHKTPRLAARNMSTMLRLCYMGVAYREMRSHSDGSCIIEQTRYAEHAGPQEVKLLDQSSNFLQYLAVAVLTRLALLYTA